MTDYKNELEQILRNHERAYTAYDGMKTAPEKRADTIEALEALLSKRELEAMKKLREFNDPRILPSLIDGRIDQLTNREEAK